MPDLGPTPDGPAHAKMLRFVAVREAELRDLARGVPSFVPPTLADLERVAK